MTDPIPDELKVRLVARVPLRDPSTGAVVVFGPDDAELPPWARDAITNPEAWGIPSPRPTRPVSDTVHESARDGHGRPNFIDVICVGRPDKPHRRLDLARFETTLLVGYRPGPPDDDAAGWASREVWEWVLTSDARLRSGVTSTGADGHPVPGSRGPVVYNPRDGSRAVRLRCDGDGGCKRPLDLGRRWDHWEAYLNDQRHTGAAEVTLLDAIRAATRS